jgi:hypothetical protein
MWAQGVGKQRKSRRGEVEPDSAQTVTRATDNFPRPATPVLDRELEVLEAYLKEELDELLSEPSDQNPQ